MDILQEVVAALHGVILQHEYQFQMAALRTSDSDLPNLSTSITPTGWINIHHVENPGSHDPGSSSKINGYSGSSNTPANKNVNRASAFSAMTTSYSSSSGESILDSLPRKGTTTQTFVPQSGRSVYASGSSMSAIPSTVPHATYSNIWKVSITSSLHYVIITSLYIITLLHYILSLHYHYSLHHHFISYTSLYYCYYIIIASLFYMLSLHHHYSLYHHHYSLYHHYLLYHHHYMHHCYVIIGYSQSCR